METPDSREPRPSAPPGIHHPHSFINVFLNDHGLRSGWRLTLYLTVALAFYFAVDLAGSFFLDYSRGPHSLSLLLFGEIADFAAVYLAAVLVSRLEHRPVRAYGLPMSVAFGRKFWLGVLLGTAEISLLMGVITLSGGYSFGPLALSGFDIVRWAFFWLVLFLFVGLFEEFLFRGYTQFTLGDGIGFWPSAIILSILFGAIHGWNPGEDWLGLAGVIVTGFVFAFSLRRTGNLWLAVGWHASFDFGETFLFSVRDSGMLFPGHLSEASLHGPAWLTGGDVGPEASIYAFITMLAGALVIHVLYPAKRRTPRPPSAAPPS